MFDTRSMAGAEREFRSRIAKLLAFGAEREDATELTVDGDRVGLEVPEGWIDTDLAELGLTTRDVEAAASHAAVYAGIEFNPMQPRFSVKIPPDLRVSVTAPPIANEWNLSVRFLRSHVVPLKDYVDRGIMSQ
jgi:type IV secretory pathway ATPase VirB11/archaellum biosynthesis ATPase